MSFSFLTWHIFVSFSSLALSLHPFADPSPTSVSTNHLPGYAMPWPLFSSLPPPSTISLVKDTDLKLRLSHPSTDAALPNELFQQFVLCSWFQHLQYLDVTMMSHFWAFCMLHVSVFKFWNYLSWSLQIQQMHILHWQWGWDDEVSHPLNMLNPCGYRTMWGWVWEIWALQKKNTYPNLMKNVDTPNNSWSGRWCKMVVKSQVWSLWYASG